MKLTKNDLERVGTLQAEDFTAIEAIKVTTDSRTVQGGELFVALKGETHDGHEFVKSALEKGALLCVVSKSWREVSNAVNLTDGLDGLAAGCSAITLIALSGFAYLTGNAKFAKYLNIVYIEGAGEVAIIALAIAAACIGFLWFNAHPAQVFMGDTGSLAIGGAIAVIALLIKKELQLPVIAGIFLIETLSVIIQRYWFKFTRWRYGEGRRVLKMAPLHHHFQMLGWQEEKIVIRFWIITLVFVMASLISLKLR